MAISYKKYNHILVPLDGSELAEMALADAFAVAHMSQAHLTLLQVVVPIEHGLDPDVDDAIVIEAKGEKYKDEALQYLNKVRELMADDTVTTHTVALLGTPAETIIDYAIEQSIDLIVMATHGRSGIMRWVYGSVADKVLRAADAPILLVRAYKETTPDR